MSGIHSDTNSICPHKNQSMNSSEEITRNTIMQRLGAPPLWRSDQELRRNEDPEQAITPTTLVTAKRVKNGKITPYPMVIDTKLTEKNHDEHPVKAIQFPTQSSGARLRRPPRGVQRQSSFRDAKARSEQGPSANKSSGARIVNRWHSKHGPSANKSSGARIVNRWHLEHGPSANKSSGAGIVQPWLLRGRIAKSKRVNAGGDLNTSTVSYEPFLKPISIPSQFSGDGSNSQQTQTKESKDVLTGNHQKKSHLRASSSFDDSPPASPKRQAPRASKPLDENVLMGQLGHHRVPCKVYKDNDKSVMALEPPIPKKAKVAPTPPKREPPKATKTLTENEFKGKLVLHSVPIKIYKDEPASKPRKRGAIPPVLARFIKARTSRFAKVGSVSQGSHQTPPQVDEGRVPLNLIETLDLNEFRRNLGRDQNPYLQIKFEKKDSYRHGIAFKVLTIAETGPQPSSPIKKKTACAA
jgi:hypothetical protein